MGAYRMDLLDPVLDQRGNLRTMSFMSTADLVWTGMAFKAESNYWMNVNGKAELQRVPIGLYINGTLMDTVNVYGPDLRTFNFVFEVPIGATVTVQIKSTNGALCYVYSGPNTNSFHGAGLRFTTSTGSYYYGTLFYEMDSVWHMDGYPELIGRPAQAAPVEAFRPKPWFLWKISAGVNEGYPYIFGFDDAAVKPGNLYVCENGVFVLLSVWLDGVLYHMRM